MEFNVKVIEQFLFETIDKVIALLSPEIWQNILLDCSKNELLVLWFLFRQKEVNMTQIAEYIHVPLNTATGIAARMEKRKLIIRERSEEDKRIVTIRLGEKGEGQIKESLNVFLQYGQLIVEEFTEEEMKLLLGIFEKAAMILDREKERGKKVHKIKKISID